MHKPPCVSRQTMRELDRAAIEEWGITGRLLMECAGRAVADEALHILRADRVGRALRKHLDPAQVEDRPEEPRTLEQLDAWREDLRRVHGPAGILCGPGNNGGDGFVVARTLLNHGVEVHTCFIGNSTALDARGDAGENFRLLSRFDHTVHVVENEAGIFEMKRAFDGCVVLIDALFGTGLTRPLAGLYRLAVEALNQAHKPVVAVDVPSGLDADTGETLGVAVRADVTVAFGAAKHGFYRGDGPRLCGRINVAEMGIPRALIQRAIEQEESLKPEA